MTSIKVTGKVETELAEARRELAKARAAWDLAVYQCRRNAYLEADERISFWSNKVAFLTHAK